MKVGLILPNILSPVSADPGAIRAAVGLAEAGGFDSVWTSDHILVPSENQQYNEGTEALMTLAYAAGMTTRIGFGLSVLILPMRNPLVVAKQIASLAHLAGREVIVGVGVGWIAREYAFLNADFRRRGRLADEYIGILRELWTNPQPRHVGTYQFEDALFAPRPAAPPPIWIGGESEAAMRRAATLGDGWQPHAGEDPADFRAKVDAFRAIAGDRRVTISASMRVSMADGPARVVDLLAAHAEVGLEYPALRFRHESLADLTAQLELFSRDVLPAIRGL